MMNILVSNRSMLVTTLLAVMLTGCGGSIPTPASTNSNTATVTLQGQLTDAATGEPVVGAKIDIGTKSAITDSNGHYEIANVQANNATGNGVTRDYQATISLTSVTSPVDMTDAAATPRYPDIKFAAPVAGSASAANHDFKVGKLSASIIGAVGDINRLPLGSVSVELQDNTTGMAGTLLRTTTSNATTGQYSFANVEAGVDYKLVGHSSDWTLQGSVSIAGLSDNQVASLQLSDASALVLSNMDTYPPRIVRATPEDNSDISPGAIDVVLTFNEPIKQDSYGIPNPATSLSNIYHDIDVSYGGQKAAGNLAHTLSWNATYDELTIAIPNTGVSSKYAVDLSLAVGKLKDIAGNGLGNSPVLTSGNLLSFTTNGGVLAAAPVIVSPNASGLDSDATSVMLDWQPVAGATKGYNIYRSTRNNLATGVVEPFVLLGGPVTASAYTDTFASSGFNLLATSEVAQFYVYRVTSVNSDLIESAPSNEVTVGDLVPPSAVGTAGTCVAAGGTSLTVTTPVTVTANGQVELTFSEALDVIAAETVGNYTGTNISAATLTSPTTVVLDFSASITCDNTNSVTVGVGITDVAGNALASSAVLTY